MLIKDVKMALNVFNANKTPENGAQERKRFTSNFNLNIWLVTQKVCDFSNDIKTF